MFKRRVEADSESNPSLFLFCFGLVLKLGDLSELRKETKICLISHGQSTAFTQYFCLTLLEIWMVVLFRYRLHNLMKLETSFDISFELRPETLNQLTVFFSLSPVFKLAHLFLALLSL